MSFPAILALEDGSIFYGDGFGEEKVEVGEIVFQYFHDWVPRNYHGPFL